MKKIFICALALLPAAPLWANVFTDLLEIKEPEKNERYYQLLPATSATNPDFSFLSSNSKELFEKIKKRFSKKNITVHQADFSGPVSKKIKSKDTTIFIFDTNTLKEPRTLNEVIEEILKVNNHYQCVYLPHALIVFTNNAKITTSPLARATTISRLYDGHNYLIEDVLEAELCIAKAQGQEKDALEKCSDTADQSGHCALWAGLIALQHENYEKAKEHLLEAKKRGLHHWRLDWYLAMAQANCFFDIR